MSLLNPDQIVPGQHVWAKIVDCRPWPAYVIKKRRPTSKHKDLIPVHFYGSIEEFSWVQSDSIIPITADNLVEFSNDCTDDEEFLAAIYQAYNVFADVCSKTGMISRASNCVTKTAPRSTTCQAFFRDCIAQIHSFSHPVNTTVGTLDSKSAELLRGIFDATLPPPTCLLWNRDTESVKSTVKSTSGSPNTPDADTKGANVKPWLSATNGCKETSAKARALAATSTNGSKATSTTARALEVTSASGSPLGTTHDSSTSDDTFGAKNDTVVSTNGSMKGEHAGIRPTRARRRACSGSPMKASINDGSQNDAGPIAMPLRPRQSAQTTGKPPGNQGKPTRKRANTMTSVSSKRKTSRVGTEFQATLLPPVEAHVFVGRNGCKGKRGSYVAKSGQSNGTKDAGGERRGSRQHIPMQTSYSTTEPQLVWDPTHCLDQEVAAGNPSEESSPATNEAFQAYLDFSCAKGILGAGNPQRSTSRGQERAHHVYHKAAMKNAMPSKDKGNRSVMLRALLELTDRRTRRRDHNHHKDESGQTYYYHYEGESVWTPEEIELFKEGLRGHGKNFAYIQSNILKTKTLPELVEYYYCFKTHDDYKPIRTLLKQRELDELKRIEAEGFLTCDNCASTRTVEWHVGDDGQDWCDSCHAYFTKRTVCTAVRYPVATAGKPPRTPRASSGRDIVGEYKCTQCDRVFQLPNSLYGHMRVHAQPKATPSAS
eukprot:m.1011971 g.1011971  ORF g.1011971 m.1011971 type:complete len:712 (+) comp24064_c0_seq11:425-2560(+)